MVVSFVLIKMSSNQTVWGIALIFSQIAAYYVIFYFQTQLKLFPSVYGMWDEYVSSAVAWLGTFLTVAWVFTIEIAARETLYYLMKWPSRFNNIIDADISEVKKEEITEMANIGALSQPFEGDNFRIQRNSADGFSRRFQSIHSNRSGSSR